MNIIFDLDGTLLNTLDDLAASTNHALSACGYPTRALEEVRQFVGNGVGKLIERAVPEGTNPSDVQRCLTYFRNHYADHCLDRTLPYPGIQSMLSELHQRGIAMAIVSNKLQPAVTELNSRFFAPTITIAVGETEQLKRKPAPDMPQQAMRLMHATEADTIYVGDSDVDILTAKAAHLPCISVTWGFRDRDFLLRHGATTIISTPQQLIDYVNLPINR
ncbi:MAG: HAD family hydrolase [Bacteroidaceae bacterium]|nr:HAD family hydrolase [Bacteroidaceae bacterium]